MAMLERDGWQSWRGMGGKVGEGWVAKLERDWWLILGGWVAKLESMGG